MNDNKTNLKSKAILGLSALVVLSLALAPAGNATSSSGWTGTGDWEYGAFPGGGDGWATNLEQFYSNNSCSLLTWDGDLLGLGLINGYPGILHTALTLDITHRYDIEDRWDGGVAIVSTDRGETWTVVEEHDGYGEFPLLTTARNCIGLLTGSVVPTTQRGWTGVSAEFATETLDLSAYITDGDTEVKLGFIFASDSSVNRPGWEIESVGLGIAGVTLLTLLD